MKLTDTEVRHVAQLARLRLNDSQIHEMADTMSSILTYMETLNQVDTSQISPNSYVMNIDTAYRADEARSSLPIDEALANAPDRVGSFYRVPQIIE